MGVREVSVCTTRPYRKSVRNKHGQVLLSRLTEHLAPSISKVRLARYRALETTFALSRRNTK